MQHLGDMSDSPFKRHFSQSRIKRNNIRFGPDNMNNTLVITTLVNELSKPFPHLLERALIRNIITKDTCIRPAVK